MDAGGEMWYDKKTNYTYGGGFFKTFPNYLLLEQALKRLTKKMNSNQPYKRQFRQLDDDVKQKISDSTRNRPKSEEHK